MVKLCLVIILFLFYLCIIDLIKLSIFKNFKMIMLKNFQMIISFFMVMILILLNYKFEKNNMFLGIYNMMLSYDYFSYGLILLSIWIILMMNLSVCDNENLSNKLLLMKIFMLLILISLFLMNNMFMFYLLFEMSLIPILLMMMNWGVLEDRISASFYMLFYTLLGSMPLLFLLFIIYKKNLTLNMMVYLFLDMNFDMSFMYYIFFILGFLVKMPLYLVHVWLPKAHVEAPVFGSMILAGVLLKLGSYGIYRFLLMIKNLNLLYNYMIVSISLIGMINISLVCLMQIDMKMLVAYSSVVHMGLLLNGILSLSKIGYESSILMNIAHGLCSSGLFYLVNVVYERSKSRNIFLNKGLMMLMPSMCLMWFLLCSSNLAAPMSLNLVSEIMLLGSLIMWSKIIIIYLIFVCFFSASYSLYLFSIIQHGKNNNLMMFNSGKLIEYLILLFHWIPLNFIILNLNMFI